MEEAHDMVVLLVIVKERVELVRARLRRRVHEPTRSISMRPRAAAPSSRAPASSAPLSARSVSRCGDDGLLGGVRCQSPIDLCCREPLPASSLVLSGHHKSLFPTAPRRQHTRALSSHHDPRTSFAVVPDLMAAFNEPGSACAFKVRIESEQFVLSERLERGSGGDEFARMKTASQGV